jgi:hypothetical protein
MNSAVSGSQLARSGDPVRGRAQMMINMNESLQAAVNASHGAHSASELNG